MSAHLDIRRLDPAAYRRTPWRNGGGVMVEIAERPRTDAEGDSWSSFVWRLARTAITTPAPFSDLSGLDRILTVISGEGLVLRRLDGGGALDVRTAFWPVRFDGAWPIRSELEAGPVEVLNLLGDQNMVAIDVRFPVEGEKVEVGLGEHVVYAPGGPSALRIESQDVSLEPDEAVLFETAAPVRIAHGTGTVAIASIRPRLP